MYENPMRNKCLDECDVGPHNCKWLWPCLIQEIVVTCKGISTGVLEKDLQDSIADLSTCEIALSQGKLTCGEIVLLEGCEYKSETIENKIITKKCVIEILSNELNSRVVVGAQ